MNLQQSITLSDKNTFKIGGKSSFYLEAVSVEELESAYNYALEKDMPVLILGKGSNILLSDKGWPGLTINTSAKMDSIMWEHDQATAYCGVLLNTLINQSINRGLSGMEELSGIPGTVGGAVLMNAGAFNSCIADTFNSASVYNTETGEHEMVGINDANFGYRTSVFKMHNKIVTSATFNFSETKSTGELKKIQREIVSRRKSKQPLDFPNCGSVFKRPPGNYAGTLIEKCGCKGLVSGDVQISEKHANFIVNKGHGLAEDVRILIRTVQKRVYEAHGLLLEPEVLFYGEFDEPLFEV